MIGNPSRGELGATVLNTFANMTRRLTRTSECTLIISETHDDVSMSAALVAMKKKYAAIKSMSKSSVTWTQLSSHSIPQITTATILKGPQHSRGLSEHSSGPMVLKSLGSSPMKDG